MPLVLSGQADRPPPRCHFEEERPSRAASSVENFEAGRNASGDSLGVARQPQPTLSPFKSAAAPTSLAVPQAQTTSARLPLGSTLATTQAPNVWPPAKS